MSKSIGKFENKLDNYRATLLGCGIGDALGMPVEGFKRGQIQKYVGRVTEFIDPVLIRDSEGNLVTEDEFGKLGYYTRDLTKGEFTDDTILTLALAESIGAGQGLNLDDVAQRQLAEYQRRLLPDGRVRGGFGTTTVQGFLNLQKGPQQTIRIFTARHGDKYFVAFFEKSKVAIGLNQGF